MQSFKIIKNKGKNFDFLKNLEFIFLLSKISISLIYKLCCKTPYVWGITSTSSTLSGKSFFAALMRGVINMTSPRKAVWMISIFIVKLYDD